MPLVITGLGGEDTHIHTNTNIYRCHGQKQFHKKPGTHISWHKPGLKMLYKHTYYFDSYFVKLVTYVRS